jgi:hypothetical protein
MTTEPAGRAVDAEVAEKVMGFEWRRVADGFQYFYSPDGDCVGIQRGDDSPRIYGSPLPSYSTDIAAAWLVVERMRKDYHIDISTCLTDRGTTWVVMLCPKGEIERPEDSCVDGSAPDAALAICLASLAASRAARPGGG